VSGETQSGNGGRRPPASKGKTKSQQRTEALERRRLCWEAHLGGANMHQIARELRIAVSTVSKHVAAHHELIKDGLREQAPAIRDKEISRLDTMLMGVWPKARAGDPRAIETVLRIMERRAKYVPGLEVPQRVDLSIQLTPEQVNQLRAVEVMSPDDLSEAYRDLLQASRPLPALPSPTDVVIDVEGNGHANGHGNGKA